MDNFHLQVTPVEITYQSKDPISLSCLVKKVVISTGHILEKHQIKSTSQLSFGKAKFREGPTFAMNKEFQAKNTKISLHFLAKKDRNISCIGSTEIYIGNLSSQPYSLIELKLDNCNDPKAKLKLQIQRKQQQPKQVKKNSNKPQKMGLLQTQGQQRQQFLLNQRANPNIPTAYQISRRNYKNVQICNDDKKIDKKSNSSKKSSYQQRHNVLNQLNPTNNKNNTSLIKNQYKLSNNSPMPRKQTPQPIQINKNTKPAIPITKPAENTKYNISGKAKVNNLQTRENKKVYLNNQQAIEQPQKLKVKPYQEQDSQNYETINRNGFKSLEQQKKYKYKFITEKLQLIHDKIANSKERVNTEQYSNNNSQYFQQNHRSCIEKSIPQNKSQELHRVKSTFGQINSFNPLTNLKIEQSPKILNQSNDSNSQKGQNKELQYENIQKKFQNIKSVKTKSPQFSPSSQKTVNIKPNQQKQIYSKQKQNNKDILNDKQIEQAEIQMYKNEIARYKIDLSNALKSITQKDYSLKQKQKDIDNYKESLEEKQNLLSKLNQQYQLIFQQNFILKEQIAKPQIKRQESIVGQFKLSQTESIKQNTIQADQKINEQMLKMRKKMLQIQSQLKFKQNENKCLMLQIDNIKRQKRNLQQQVQILVSKDKNQITRKASIARIEQISTNSLAHNAKKQNQILKNQVKILQQKLQSLNSLFQSLIHPNQKGKNKVQPVSNQNNDLQKKYKVLQQKCMLLQEQLKKKKNELAEIINVIWKHQNGDLMNEVFALITQSQP